MNDGMIGLSPEQARDQLHSFGCDCTDIIGHFFRRDGFHPFRDALYEAWCSPKAQEFGKTHLTKLLMIEQDITKTAHNIIARATNAYNKLATSNGLSPIDWSEWGLDYSDGNLTIGDPTLSYVFDYIGKDGDGNYLRAVSPDGIVGMNKNRVKQALDNLNVAVNTCINELNNLPMDIAFYDPNGEMQAGFKELIKDMISEIHDVMNEIKKEINTAINEESDAIELAKNQAVEAMNS